MKVEDQSDVQRETFILILKSIADKVDDHLKLADALNSSYHLLMENYKLFEIIRDDWDFVDFIRFREVYMSKRMNVLDLIDLIANAN